MQAVVTLCSQSTTTPSETQIDSLMDVMTSYLRSKSRGDEYVTPEVAARLAGAK